MYGRGARTGLDSGSSRTPSVGANQNGRCGQRQAGIGSVRLSVADGALFGTATGHRLHVLQYDYSLWKPGILLSMKESEDSFLAHDLGKLSLKLLRKTHQVGCGACRAARAGRRGGRGGGGRGRGGGGRGGVRR